jgi:hypothetical protein
MMRGIGKAVLGSTLSLGLVFAATDAAAQAGGDQLTASGAQITIPLEAVGPAEASGAAVLSAADGQTRIALDVEGAPADAELSGVLVAGGCTQPGEVIAELGTASANASGEATLSADVPVDLAAIAALPVSVQLRQADASIACGEHAASAEAPASSPAREPMPDAIPVPDDTQDDAPAADPLDVPVPTDPQQ